MRNSTFSTVLIFMLSIASGCTGISDGDGDGIADADDSRRDLYIKRYLYAVSKAIKNGYDVIGYFYWSLMDNFEWAFGYDMKFGLFSVDYETQERSLRDGSKAYIDIVKNEN